MNNRILGKEWERYLQLKKERPDSFKENGLLHIVWDEEVVARYELEHGKKIGVIYESPYHILVVDLVYETQGKYFAYERIMQTVQKGAVVVVPVYNNKLILLKQYRHAIRDYQFSFPRGFGEPDISAEENVKKELCEEIGAQTGNVVYLGKLTPDSGMSASMVSIYACQVLSYDAKARSEAIADILELTLEELQQWIVEGKITDGFTISGIGMYGMRK